MQFHSCPLFVSITPIKKGIVNRFAIFESDNSQDTRHDFTGTSDLAPNPDAATGCSSPAEAARQ